MKLAFLCLTLTILTASAQGQLAVIRDSDGYTNVRAVKSINAKIVGRLFANDIFLYKEEDIDSNWIEVFYNLDLLKRPPSERDYNFKTHDLYIQGYIHLSKFLPIDSLRHVPLTSKYRTSQEHFLQIQKDSIKLKVRALSFKEQQHTILRDKDGFVQKIDGNVPKGVDGNLPHFQLSSIELTINGKTITIPERQYNDLYEPGLSSCNIFFGDNGNIYVYMRDNSDGAGYYSVAWLIKNGEFIKRYVDSL